MRILLIALVLAMPALADVCPEFPQRSEITVSTATGNQQILAVPASGKSITVCGLSINADTAGVVKITAGTGTNCGTGTVTIWTFGANVTGATRDRGDFPLPIPTGSAVCLNFSATVSASGSVFWVVR